MDYIAEYKRHVRENVKNVLNEIGTKGMTVKISHWADKFGYSVEEIENKIKTDKIFRCIFAKNPSRQNIYQKTAAEDIKSLSIVQNFQILSSRGKGAISLTRDRILRGKDITKQSKNTKPIHFKWNCKGFTFYGVHMYTDMNGGSQGNQYQDIQGYLKCWGSCKREDTILSNL